MFAYQSFLSEIWKRIPVLNQSAMTLVARDNANQHDRLEASDHDLETSDEHSIVQNVASSNQHAIDQISTKTQTNDFQLALFTHSNYHQINKDLIFKLSAFDRDQLIKHLDRLHELIITNSSFEPDAVRNNEQQIFKLIDMPLEDYLSLNSSVNESPPQKRIKLDIKHQSDFYMDHSLRMQLIEHLVIFRTIYHSSKSINSFNNNNIIKCFRERHKQLQLILVNLQTLIQNEKIHDDYENKESNNSIELQVNDQLENNSLCTSDHWSSQKMSTKDSEMINFNPYEFTYIVDNKLPLSQPYLSSSSNCTPDNESSRNFNQSICPMNHQTEVKRNAFRNPQTLSSSLTNCQSNRFYDVETRILELHRNNAQVMFELKLKNFQEMFEAANKECEFLPVIAKVAWCPTLVFRFSHFITTKEDQKFLDFQVHYENQFVLLECSIQVAFRIVSESSNDLVAEMDKTFKYYDHISTLHLIDQDTLCKRSKPFYEKDNTLNLQIILKLKSLQIQDLNTA